MSWGACFAAWGLEPARRCLPARFPEGRVKHRGLDALWQLPGEGPGAEWSPEASGCNHRTHRTARVHVHSTHTPHARLLTHTHPLPVSTDPHSHAHSGILQDREPGGRGDGDNPRLTCWSPAETRGYSWHESPRRLPAAQATGSGLGEPGPRIWGSRAWAGAASRGSWAGPRLGAHSLRLRDAVGGGGRRAAEAPPRQPVSHEGVGRSLGRRGRASGAPPLRGCAAPGRLPSSCAQCPHPGNGLCGSH